MIVVVLLTLLGMLAASPEPVRSNGNRWAEPTRGILAQRCGQCHLPNLPTSVPRALLVFDLTEEPWYGRLTHEQLDSLLLRTRSIREMTDADRSTVESFVHCARDQACSPVEP